LIKAIVTPARQSARGQTRRFTVAESDVPGRPLADLGARIAEQCVIETIELSETPLSKQTEESDVLDFRQLAAEVGGPDAERR
jgi:hypothetical protein